MTMKNYIREFLLKGLVACGFGPIVLAVVYLIMQKECGIQTLTVNQVCLGIISLTALAFIAGGMNAIYKVEQLPLMMAILIHGGVLYACYLGTYLLNGWLEQGAAPILVFTGIFILGYLTIWAIIFYETKRRTARVNELLKRKREAEADIS